MSGDGSARRTRGAALLLESAGRVLRSHAMGSSDTSAKEHAATRLVEAGAELRAAKARFEADGCRANRERYEAAIEEMELAQLEAQAALHDCAGCA